MFYLNIEINKEKSDRSYLLIDVSRLSPIIYDFFLISPLFNLVAKIKLKKKFKLCKPTIQAVNQITCTAW